MPKRKSERTQIPENFETLQQFWDFWNDRSLADYADQLRPVDCHINIVRRTRMVPVEPDLLKDLTAYAHARGVSCEALINLWLREHLTTKTAKSAAA